MPIEFLVRAKGIEPSSKAWEAFVLPLYHARKPDILHILYHICLFVQAKTNFISFCTHSYPNHLREYDYDDTDLCRYLCFLWALFCHASWV